LDLESEEADFAVISDEPKPDFCDLAALALENAGISPDNRLCAARKHAANTNMNPYQSPALVGANDNKIEDKTIFNLLDARLGVNAVHPDTPPLLPSGSYDDSS
jgi:hypothetical protein